MLINLIKKKELIYKDIFSLLKPKLFKCKKRKIINFKNLAQKIRQKYLSFKI